MRDSFACPVDYRVKCQAMMRPNWSTPCDKIFSDNRHATSRIATLSARTNWLRCKRSRMTRNKNADKRIAVQRAQQKAWNSAPGRYGKQAVSYESSRSQRDTEFAVKKIIVFLFISIDYRRDRW